MFRLILMNKQRDRKQSHSSELLANPLAGLKNYIPVEDREQTQDEKGLNGSFNRPLFRNIPVKLLQMEAPPPAKIIAGAVPLSEATEEDLAWARAKTAAKKEHKTDEIKEVSAAPVEEIKEHKNEVKEEEKTPILVHQTSIDVVALKPHSERAQDLAKKTQRAFSHLRARKKVSPFIAPYLGSNQSGKVSLKANGGDFLGWLKKRKIAGSSLSKNELLSLISQLISAVAFLHTDGLKHRDIKPENILVHETPEKGIHLLLADPDEIIGNADTNVEIAGTPLYIAPEMLTRKFFVALEQNNREERANYIDISYKNGIPIFNIAQYKRADKKKYDCYAVGCILEDIQVMGLMPALSESELESFEELRAGLMAYHPQDRLTIEQAMKSPLFGSTPEARQAHFQKLEKDFEQPETWIDDYYYHTADDMYPDNDVFFALPASLKEIYMQAFSLKNQLQYIKDRSLTYDEFIVINKRIKNLLLLIRNEKTNCKKNSKLDILLDSLISDITEAQKNVQLTGKEWFEYHLLHVETVETRDQLLTKLEQSTTKQQDFTIALSMLDTCIHEEKDKNTKNLLITTRNEIAKEAPYLQDKNDLPLLTESLLRLQMKAKYPNHPTNHVDLEHPEKNGANTQRGIELSEKISNLKWGKCTGALGKLIFGTAMLGTAAALIFAPPITVLAGLGILAYVTITTALIGTTAGIGIGSVTMGGIELENQISKKKNQTGSKEIPPLMNRFFTAVNKLKTINPAQDGNLVRRSQR